jgi:hypothetical protein
MPVSFCVESISLKDKRNLKKLSLGRNKGEEENQFELNYFLEHTQSNTRARRNGFLKKENVSVQRSGRFFSARFHRRRRPPREDEEEEVAVFLSFFFLLLHVVVVVVVVVFFPSS